MKRLLFIMTIAAFAVSTYSADISKIKFDYLTVDAGLSQGIVEEIFQDSQGYMWFGTHDGLNRYDGLNFTVYRSDRNDHNSLASNWVYSVAEDKEGKIWIGTNGLNVYDPVADKISLIPVDAENPNAYHGGRVYQISVDNDSTLWISTANGLVHYFPKKRIFKTYNHDPGKAGSLASSDVFSTCVTKDGRLFVAANADPIYEYDRKSDAFKEINYRVAYTGNNSNKFIVEDNNGLLYITSEFSAVHIYNPLTGETKLLDKGENGLNINNIRTGVLPVSGNEVWVGTDGGGVNVYNSATGEIHYLMMDPKNNQSLGGNAVTSLFMDRDGNVWVGHFGTGISVWKRNKEKFTSYSNNPFDPTSINKEVVTAIYEDSQRRIWIGQDGGGLSIFNEFTGKFDHILKSGNAGLTSDVILSIIEDHKGNLLLGTYAGGMMVFNPETRKVVKSYNASNGMITDHAWTFFIDSKGRYWLSDLRSGYSRYFPETGTFENHPMGNEELSACSNAIMTIAEDAKGNLWMGSENGGICIIDYDKKIKKSYHHDPSNPNSLSNDDVKSIAFIGDYVWIATNGGGLNRLDPVTDSFRIYTMKEGLSSDALQGFLKDKNDNLWISSTKGLMKFHTLTGEVEIFEKSQGIQGNEFKYNSQRLLSDGRMAFGGVNGMTVFHPDSIKKSNIKASVVFTGFEIMNQEMEPGKKGSPLKKHINYTDFIRLNHRQSVITIKFASLDYNSPEKNRYMYKMEGFDEDWIDAGSRRFATYTNLDPGKYTFLLKGSNSDGVWNDIPRKIIFRVRPPWYTNKITILLYILVTVFGIYYYIRQRERQTIQDKIILQKKIDEAEAELKAKTRKVEEHALEIKRRDEEEREIRFYTEGIARMSDIIAKKRKNLEELSTSVISELTRYVDAAVGGIFVMDDSDPNHIMLRATGEFCLSTDGDINYVFESGEGNIGACFREKQTIASDNLPEGYIHMRSGLGSISLHHALFIPILQDNECVGVIEIASLEKLPENKVKFCEKIAESLASIIIIIRANEKAGQMIEQNNAQAEELRTQEEEMRQNVEELMATQEESQRRENDILEQIRSKDELISKLQEQLISVTNKKSKNK